MIGAHAYAVCVACGAFVAHWRERLGPLRDGHLVSTEQSELAVRVREKGACSSCGEDLIEIRVQDLH